MQSLAGVEVLIMLPILPQVQNIHGGYMKVMQRTGCSHLAQLCFQGCQLSRNHKTYL